MNIQFGFIGLKEIEKAKEALVKQYRFDNGSWIPKKIWFEKPHSGRVRGYTYDDIVEVLDYETDCTLYTFEDITRVEAFAKEFSCTFTSSEMKTFEKIFKKNKIAYMLEDVISDDSEFLCWDKICDGQYIWTGTVEEAYNYLVERSSLNNYIELIVSGVLK